MGEDLQLHISRVEQICRLIENGEEYMDELTGYLPLLNQTVNSLLAYVQNQKNPIINAQFVVQVLKDILYGMEHRDSVFLLDTLRYGLLQLYSYASEELQDGEAV